MRAGRRLAQASTRDGLRSLVSFAEFVQLVSSEANELVEKEKKTLVTPEHVVAALQVRRSSGFQHVTAAHTSLPPVSRLFSLHR